MNCGWFHYPAIATGAPGGEQAIARGWLRSAYYLYQSLKQHISVVDFPRSSHPKIILHYCPPHVFTPIRGKVNVLFSMYEGGALPPEFVSRMRLADWCVVPSRYNQDVWRAHGFQGALCPLGLTDEYLFCQSERPILASGARTLRFLWVGSQLGRKGWELLMPAWSQVFNPSDSAQLYIKTIGSAGIQELYGGKLVIDQRDLSEAEMLELYLSADVFVFPSLGEGFGLPALEAMAAGCLVVAPAITGLTEFVEPYTAVCIALSQPVIADYGAKYEARFPTVEGLTMAMRRVRDGWGTPALETIRRTGIKHARTFTWRASGARLAEVLTAIAEKKGVPAEERVLVH